MRHRMGVEQPVQPPGEIVLGTLVEQLVDQFSETALPEQILEPAAGLGKTDGQAAQFVGVGRDALAGSEAVAFHGREVCGTVNLPLYQGDGLDADARASGGRCGDSWRRRDTSDARHKHT